MESEGGDVRQAVGKAGEKFAAAYLRHRGFRILYQNFRGPKGGEVDIVARDGSDLAFIEVKTRTGDSHGRPSDAVTGPKQRLIARGAREWVRQLRTPPARCRFDVLEVILTEGECPDFVLLEDAFEAPEGLQAEM